MEASRKLFWKIARVIVLICVVMVILKGEDWYWDYYPFNPATIHKIIATSPNREVCPGEELYYEAYLEKFPIYDLFGNVVSQVVTVKRALVNSHVIPISPATPPHKGYGELIVSSSVSIPRSADYGALEMDWEAEYMFGPRYRRIARKAPSRAKFTVIPCDWKDAVSPKGGAGIERGVPGDRPMGKLKALNKGSGEKGGVRNGR